MGNLYLFGEITTTTIIKMGIELSRISVNSRARQPWTCAHHSRALIECSHAPSAEKPSIEQWIGRYKIELSKCTNARRVFVLALCMMCISCHLDDKGLPCNYNWFQRALKMNTNNNFSWHGSHSLVIKWTWMKIQVLYLERQIEIVRNVHVLVS